MWMSFVKLAVRQTIVLAFFKFVRQEPQFPGLGLAMTRSDKKLVLVSRRQASGLMLATAEN
jgi:hypothetical protein